MADRGEPKGDLQEANTDNSVENGSTNGRSHPVENGQVDDQPEREITQTDHLNKKLLDSFLQRINAASGGVPVVERISTSDNEEEADNAQEPDNNIIH